jgi:hypothetical protein
MTDLIDVLIEAQTDLDWCADPTELERALIRLVDLEPRDDVAAPLQQKIAQLKLARELGRVTQHGTVELRTLQPGTWSRRP